jgi:hypothetical protein
MVPDNLEYFHAPYGLAALIRTVGIYLNPCQKVARVALYQPGVAGFHYDKFQKGIW